MALRDQLHVDEDTTSPTSRPLGKMEQMLVEQERINRLGTITSVLLTDSTQELNEGRLRRALKLLSKRTPLLRMRIKGSGDQRRFEEMENPQEIDFQLLNHITADEWIDGFEEELNMCTFDIEMGPLWRVRLLQESSAEGMYRNAVVFTFHHVICDVMSIFQLERKLLEMLNSLERGEEVGVKSLPLSPSLESLMTNLAKPSKAEKVLFSRFLLLSYVKDIIIKPTNLYLALFPPAINSDASVERKTRFLARSLSWEETKALLTSCKGYGCTVHGALTAAVYLAILQAIRDKTPLQNPLSIDSSYSISMRKKCQPQVDQEVFGVYVLGNVLTIKVPLLETNDTKGFWEFAATCTREVHAQLDSGKYCDSLKLYDCFSPATFCKITHSENNEGRRKEIFGITNAGALSARR